MDKIQILLYIVLPYLSLLIFIVGSVYRYRYFKYKYSSLSSQFLEQKNVFWGTVPFHVGIVLLFLGHLFIFIFPKEVLIWNSDVIRLIILETGALILGLSSLFGLSVLIVRRITNSRLRKVTTKMDFTIEFLILFQIILGIWIAYGYRWGTSWFAAVLSPYLTSLLKFQPDIQAVSQMPWVIQFHIVGAFIIVLLIPFSRLVHFLVPPVNYIWRPYQQVIWNWSKKKARRPEEIWTVTRPKNN